MRLNTLRNCAQAFFDSAHESLARYASKVAEAPAFVNPATT
jgi:hypothetical protein